MARAKTSHGEEKKSLRSDKDDLKPLDDATTGGGGRNRVIVEDDELFESERSMEDSGESSFSSSELAEDASSSTLDSPPLSSPSSSPNSVSTSGPLYGMSDLMANLPVKRGLSKFYQGKSQSFTSLARVDSIEDLAKKENPYQRRLKMCRSYAGGLDNQKSYSPRATISKRSSSRGSLLSSSSLQKRK